MALLPLTMALIRFMGTQSARPSSFRLTPVSSSSSRSNSPGWMGGSFLRCAMVLLSVVIHDLDVVRIAVTPGEADPPAVIDPNAVLADPVPFQGNTNHARTDTVSNGQFSFLLARGASRRRYSFASSHTSSSFGTVRTLRKARSKRSEGVPPSGGSTGGGVFMASSRSQFEQLLR